VRLDLTDIASIRAAISRAFAELGRIDVLVNNAGYGLLGAAEGFTDAQIEEQIATNLTGSIQVVRAALPGLREQGGGRIIQVSSYSGQAAHPGSSIYNASKWGIEGFMEAMAHELTPFNIGVTIAEPGGARTDFRRAASTHSVAPLPAYEGTPAGTAHALLKDTNRLSGGDPAKMAQAMIDSVDRVPAPRRLVLGSDSYAIISEALAERLADVEAQKDMAALTDITTA
jgi:NAD(P)-dependent dehydrogenase (short-subunit alcohol dehydrogenase family)